MRFKFLYFFIRMNVLYQMYNSWLVDKIVPHLRLHADEYYNMSYT